LADEKREFFQNEGVTGLKTNIRKYARIGLVHHMLYPECTLDPDYHVETLEKFIERDDIETFDCCIPYGDARRERLTAKIRACGKEVVYAMHLFPLRKISLSSLNFQEQSFSKLVMKDQVEIAAAIGSTGFVFVSGADLPDQRDAARASFRNFCRWFSQECAPHGIVPLLEPFDRTIDKKFLYGPIDECVELIESLEREGHTVAIELDIAHLPLMGEDLAGAVRRSGRHIRRLHLGNCVLKDKTHPLYGDLHPPMGIPGGEINAPELAVILAELLKIGFLNPDNRGALILEMVPSAGIGVEETIQSSFAILEAAWQLV
jgi:sugar phosphate isomerase/epimerase